MTLWLCQVDRRTGRPMRRNLDALPCFAINSTPQIIGDTFAEHYWLEDDDVTAWLHLDARGSFDNRRTINTDTTPAPTVNAGGIGPGNSQSHYWIENDGRPDNMRDDSKPPFRVPTMAEIAAVPWNGHTVISTFAGCGGSSLGYRMAGFKVLWASEFIEAARAVYEANAPGTPVDGRDIRVVDPQEVMRSLGIKRGELDVLDGSPPCASFSTAGKRERGWNEVRPYSDTEQRVDDLFYEYARMVDGFHPKVFVAENVSGLVKGVAKGWFLDVLARLKACGYRVETRLLDAQWLGVPQARQRIIFMGVREDLALAPSFPKPLAYRYSVRDAIPWIGKVILGDPKHNKKPGVGFARGEVDDANVKPCRTVQAAVSISGTTAFVVESETDISRFAIGAEADKLNPGQQSDKFFSLTRAPLDGPSPTVTATGSVPGAAGVIHPTEKRKFSIAELKRICAFPDDFILLGSFSQQWERLGRAVPPVMMRAIAERVRDDILAKIEKKPHVRNTRNLRSGPRRRSRAA